MRSFFRIALNQLTKQMPELHLSNNDLFVLAEEVSVVEGVDDLANAFFAAAKESLYRNAYWVSDVSYITDLMKLHPQIFTPDDRERIIETVRNIVDNHLDDDDAQLLSDELSTIEDMERKYNFGLHKEVVQLRKLLSSAEENCPPEEDYDDDSYRGGSGGGSISNDALADMFSTLLR